jgi:hypothetical protein
MAVGLGALEEEGWSCPGDGSGGDLALLAAVCLERPFRPGQGTLG